MSDKKPSKGQVTNPTIPQAATILKASTQMEKKVKNAPKVTEGLNDATQTSV